MAEFIKSKNSEPRYVFEFTRAEVKLMADTFGDMAEGRCYLSYPEEHGSNTKPNEASMKKLRAMVSAIDKANAYDVTDDYFDRWETVGASD
jgi:hypothetical protein